MILAGLGLLGLLVSLLSNVYAQTSSAVCGSGWDWASNSMGQNPCIMASYSRAVCTGNYDVVVLDPGHFYIGPDDPKWSEPCLCSSVTYSLLSACQVCQGELSVRTWAQWTTNCTAADTFDGSFPKDIPVGTAFPAWAYRVYQGPDVFSSVQAQDIKSTNGTEITRTSSASGTPSPTVDPSKTPKPDSKSNAGPIAGGVVGGIAGLAIIAIAIFFFLRRRKQNRTSPSQMYQLEKAVSDDETTPFTPPQVLAQRDAGGALRYYDPSDPSTFPSPPSPPPQQTGSSSNHSSSNQQSFAPLRVPEL